MFKIKKVHVKIQISASEKPEDLGISLHFPTRINDFKSSGLFFFFFPDGTSKLQFWNYPIFLNT